MTFLLSSILFLPLAATIGVAFLPKQSERKIRLLAMVASLGTFALCIVAAARFDSSEAGYQFLEKYDWVPTAGASYHVGIDGISLWLVVLTALLFPVAILASWQIDKRVKAFHIVLLLLETGILGVFVSLDLVLFYVFWEAMLVPMYFLIGLWGYKRRVYAAVKFFIFTLTGSLFMLAGVIALYFLGGRTFDITSLSAAGLSPAVQGWLFAAFFVSFAVKVPIFPLHTWLPDAHTEAPTAGSVILAGVLLKMGAYGFLRFSIPFFPDAAQSFAPYLALLGVIGIVYGGLVSIMQRDLKRLVAFSSISHLGFIVLGIAALSTQSTSGSVLQMINHGLSTGLLFLLVGMLYERSHTREISEMQGVNRMTPALGGVFLFAALASLGLPGLAGFTGEFLILNGSFDAFRVLSIVGTAGVVIAAIYLLWAYERVFTGPVRSDLARRLWRDFSIREVVVVAPMVVLILFLGLYPKPLLDNIEPSVAKVVENQKASTK